MIFTICTEIIEVLVADNTCFSATDGEYALDYKFNATYNGTINGVRLVYNSGGVTCSYAYALTNWGCHSSGGDLITTGVYKIPQEYTSSRDALLLYPTSDTDDIVSLSAYSSSSCQCDVSTYTMNSADLNSDEIELYSQTTKYNVSINDEFMLGYHEAICDRSWSDNQGTACAQVYFLYSNIDQRMLCLCDFVSFVSFCHYVVCSSSATVIIRSGFVR